MPACPACYTQTDHPMRPYRATAALFVACSLYTCSSCGLVFASPQPTPDALADYYRSAYRADHPERGYGTWSAARARARSQLQFAGGAPNSLLDVGAGWGVLLEEARRAGVQRLGAVEPGARNHARLAAFTGDVWDTLAQVTGQWELITFSHVLEHIADPLAFLGQVAAHLSPGGRVVCEVPHELHLDAAPSDEPHLLFFTAAPLRVLFERAGFSVLRVQAFRSRDARWQAYTRRALSRLGVAPTPALDRLLFPHFTPDNSGGWLRLAAHKSAYAPGRSV